MTLLGGRYTLDVPLGDSDLGTVWNAHDENGTQLVVVTLEADAPEPIVERFRAHAKALLKIHHPSVVAAVAEGDHEGAPYLVVERLVGESLNTRLENGPSPTVARIVEIGVALAEGLAAVHGAGIAHGDVEPGNVLLVGEPGKEVPKLIGFGLNRASLRQELGARMSLPSLGPVAYAAPEQARGDALDGPLADQASLAALVYAALGGRPPHIARDIAALATAIGTERPPLLTMARRELAPFASTLDRALSSDPKKRFSDMGAFARALKTAGTMARSIAITRVPLGARSAIGEPPAPALPRAATIPKPAGALGGPGGARVALPGKLVGGVPKPGAAKIPSPGAARAIPAQPPPTSTPQPPPKAPVGEPEERTTQELEVGDLVAAVAAPAASPPPPPPPTSTPQPPPKAPVMPTEELDASELSVDSATLPISEASTELDSAELTSLPPEKPKAVAPPPPPPPPASEPAHEAAAPASAQAEPEVAPAHTPADDWKPAPPPPHTDAPAPPSDEPAVQLSPSMERIVTETAAAQAKPPPPPPLDVPEAAEDAPPAIAIAPDDEDDAPSLDSIGGRKPWMVPAAIAAVVVLAFVSWAGYRATRPETPTEPAGHTLTVTAPPSTVAPTTTVAIPEPPPSTIVEAPEPPPSVVAPPPSVVAPPPSVVAPPPSVVAPPPVTRATPPPPATRTSPPATTARPHPPATTTTRRPPPTTSVRPPPPTTTARRPPPTTTSRPTVVSDPGF